MDKKDLKQIYNSSPIGLLILLVIVGIMPFVVNSNYIFAVFIMIGIYAIVCNGLTMLIGYAGQISLGHAAFYGIGAYSSAIVSATYGLSPWLGILVGMIIAAIVALVVGIPTFKLKGHYLALATLGFGIIVFTLFKEFRDLTGGSNGFFGIPSISFFGFEFNSDARYFYLVWLFVILGIIFSRNIINSRIGRALRSIEGSEIASDAVGVNIMSYKLQVFVLSAMSSSLAGSLLAHYVSFINPDLFGVMTSIYFLIMVIIGGSQNIWGSIIGACTYVLLGETLKQYIPILLPSTGGEFEIVFFGVLLVVTLIYMPHGLAPQLERLFSKFNRKKAGKQPSLQVRKKQIASGGENQ
ncbi:branched-chain amino acid ABC transporter permease [Neobacillus sp. OS1-32]|uniref:branched-chain amino acid ABC transporter permease n=1 Tax=Neobacillus sp. OS1-32 TaxID=3070682 RepID=UPI0027DF313D|nr:branched-chain amino acid ABC transporter permease [Neobacillus sp. OS1-32]WML31748.1 branched-chain amino acid ABC transporter permease [Neobacillus sp. OS1-32]